MRQLPLLAAVAAVAGLFASSAAVRSAARPTLVADRTPARVARPVSAPPFTVRKVGEAIVSQVGHTWRVSLRYSATAPGSASMTVTRDTEHVQTFRYASGTGIVTVGPFVFTEPGQYRFALVVTNAAHATRSLAWSACVACGALRPPVVPLRKLGEPRVVKGTNGWTVTVSFETLRAGHATIRLVSNGKTLTTFAFAPKPGRVDVGPFVVPNAGRYELLLRLTDTAGVTRSLAWEIVAK